MDFENDKYWRQRVEAAEAETDFWRSMIVNYVFASEGGIHTEATQYYNRMLTAVEKFTENDERLIP